MLRANTTTAIGSPGFFELSVIDAIAHPSYDPSTSVSASYVIYLQSVGHTVKFTLTPSIFFFRLIIGIWYEKFVWFLWQEGDIAVLKFTPPVEDSTFYVKLPTRNNNNNNNNNPKAKKNQKANDQKNNDQKTHHKTDNEILENQKTFSSQPSFQHLRERVGRHNRMG